MVATKNLEFDQNSIYEASSAEIRTYANENCGIEFTKHADRDSMIKQVVEAMGWLAKDPSEDATHVEIMIAREAGVTGNFPYRGGANGEMFSIKRDVATIIPIKFWESIKSAQNRAGFTVVPLTEMLESSPSEKRIPSTGVPISILRWIKE